ncbi:MAG: hypothetical protein WC520_04700 [Candidatus Paceibacterota bacterium]
MKSKIRTVLGSRFEAEGVADDLFGIPAENGFKLLFVGSFTIFHGGALVAFSGAPSYTRWTLTERGAA